MRSNRRTDTGPERRLRSELHSRGCRFRKDYRVDLGDLRLRVDIAFPSARVAVFVDGCFWHKCPEHGTDPKLNDHFMKNERIGFSITYYENGRPRQYFPDFVVLAQQNGEPVTWVIETKGEIRPNTMLKKEAADLWCDRMARADQGDWRHLFVRQPVFERVMKDGIETLADLVAAVEAKEKVAA